jgi:hypothetical protein
VSDVVVTAAYAVTGREALQGGDLGRAAWLLGESA